MATLFQRSFAAGELSPECQFRVDQNRYSIGAKSLLNMLVKRSGGACNRPGTKFICEVGDSTYKPRLLPFVYNNDESYVLEVGYEGRGFGSVRPLKAGRQIVNTVLLSGISNANPGVLTSLMEHHLSIGDEVKLGIIEGMPSLSGRSFKVKSVPTDYTFTLESRNGVQLDTLGLGTFISGEIDFIYYAHASVFAGSAIDGLKYVQSADVMTVVHQNIPPTQIKRYGDHNWAVEQMSFEPKMARPTGGTTSGSGSSGGYNYAVTAISEVTGEESLTGLEVGKAITGITKAFPAVVTSNGHGIGNGQLVYISGVSGMAEINNRWFKVASSTTNTFALDGIDSSTYGTYTSGGTVSRDHIRSTYTLSTSSHITVNWTAVAGAREYNIYRTENGVFGLIGVSRSTSFVDKAIDPDLTVGPPVKKDQFFSNETYPSAVSYYQQRLLFAASDSKPETVFASRTGNYSSFAARYPIQDDDSFEFPVVGERVNRVRHLKDFGKLLILTQGGEHGAEAGVLTPSSVELKRYSSNGASDLEPLEADGLLLYVQERGSQVRYLRFSQETQSFNGEDLTDFSKHLFDGHKIVSWAYQANPYSTVWAVRDDGKVLSLALVTGQEIAAWTPHDFGAHVEGVCCIPEGNFDAVYFLVRREIDGRTVRYIERLHERIQSDKLDHCFMDCARTFDGRKPKEVQDHEFWVVVSGGSTWSAGEEMDLQAFYYYGTNIFNQHSVGQVVSATVGDKTIDFEIVSVTDSETVRVKPDIAVPVEFRGTDIFDFQFKAKVIRDLWHLDGQRVVAICDGYEYGNPNVEDSAELVVENGQVELDQHYGVVTVGLPYISDVVTLDIDTAPAGRPSSEKINIAEVSLRLVESRGVMVGPSLPKAGDPATKGLRPIKTLEDGDPYDYGQKLLTGKFPVSIERNWRSSGSIAIRQASPYPFDLTAVEISGLIPGGG